MANWYGYTGIGDPFIASSYRLITVGPNCTSGTCKICAIYLNDTSTVPSYIDSNVLLYIGNALASQFSQPPGVAKRFVYLKNC